jgi:hypothetical protein
MLTQERTAIARPLALPSFEEERRAPVGPAPRPAETGSGLLGRLVLAGVGFAIAFTGWMLVMTVLLVFIGLPMFFFGLAVMQAQER